MNPELHIELRTERPEDYPRVEILTREAFWNVYAPGCSEHYLVHIMRDSADFIPELDVVALADGKIVGNIMYTHSAICIPNGERFPIITFGPISVLPEYQSRGIGGALIEKTKKMAKDLGYQAIAIVGDPEYYKRFGFVSGESKGVRTADGKFAAALQVCELVPNALEGKQGNLQEAEIFGKVTVEASEEFDKGFIAKEKKSGLSSQQRFAELVAMVHD